mgnify:CR=1 FL=1
MKSKMSKVKCQKSGIAALPMILMLGGFIAEIAIAATLGAYLLINSEFGTRLS